MRILSITLGHTTPLLMDRDNISFAEKVTRWQKDPKNADAQVPGDDRAPAWGWLGKLHCDEAQVIGIPEGMLGACLRAAGATMPHPTAKGSKTLKEASQAGLRLTQPLLPLLTLQPGLPDWHPLNYGDIFLKLSAEDDFLVHEEVVKHYGFRLDVRRASPQFNRKHIRVRPMFPEWRCLFNLHVFDDILTDPVLLHMFRIAGETKGLGNWRPSNSKAGSYGLFSVLHMQEVTQEG